MIKLEEDQVDDLISRELLIQINIYKGYAYAISKGMSPDIFHGGNPEADLAEIQDHIKAYERVLSDFTEQP